MLTAHSQLPLLSQHCAEGQDLTATEIEQAIHDLLEPNVSVETKAEFLLCLARKGETPREIADFAIILRDLALDPGLDIGMLGGILIDTCGTGGDGSNTYNISTATALLLAAGDIPVAKHGNRSITSKCGSADVLEALGINLEMPPSKIRESIEKHRFAFLYAPFYHKTFKSMQPVRKYLAEKGHRTIFNLLGPLVNPARPNVQIVGVYNPSLTDLYTQVLLLMKAKRALVVHGFPSDSDSGMDELCSFGKSRLTQLHSNGKIETIELDGASFGFQKATLKDVQGGDAKANAEIIRKLFSDKDDSARRDLLAYNAGIGFVLAGQAKELSLGIQKAFDILKSGAAAKKLEDLAAFSKA